MAWATGAVGAWPPWRRWICCSSNTRNGGVSKQIHSPHILIPGEAKKRFQRPHRESVKACIKSSAYFFYGAICYSWIFENMLPNCTHYSAFWLDIQVCHQLSHQAFDIPIISVYLVSVTRYYLWFHSTTRQIWFAGILHWDDSSTYELHWHGCHGRDSDCTRMYMTLPVHTQWLPGYSAYAPCGLGFCST
jgi:hypothetical protein